MTRYTTAYSSFLSRLDEVRVLQQFALDKERLDPLTYRYETNALCRGSVVLLSSHVEAYIKEVGELALESLSMKGIPRDNISYRFFYHISKSFLEDMRNTSDPEKLAEKVFLFLQSDLEYWSRSGPFPLSIQSERFNTGFSNPGFNKIKAYFNRFGYSQYKLDLERKLQSQFLTTVNMIDHMVDTRNKVAHGDPNAGKTPLELKDMIVLIQKFCAATDSVFATWWRRNYCSIR